MGAASLSRLSSLRIQCSSNASPLDFCDKHSKDIWRMACPLRMWRVRWPSRTSFCRRVSRQRVQSTEFAEQFMVRGSGCDAAAVRRRFATCRTSSILGAIRANARQLPRYGFGRVPGSGRRPEFDPATHHRGRPAAAGKRSSGTGPVDSHEHGRCRRRSR